MGSVKTEYKTMVHYNGHALVEGSVLVGRMLRREPILRREWASFCPFYDVFFLAIFAKFVIENYAEGGHFLVTPLVLEIITDRT